MAAVLAVSTATSASLLAADSLTSPVALSTVFLVVDVDGAVAHGDPLQALIAPQSRSRMKQELTRCAPFRVLISCRAGRTVSAVE